MKKLSMLSKAFLVVLTLVMLLAPVVNATSYATYTYSSEGEILYSPDAYVPQTVVDSKYIGLDVPMSNLTDVCVDDDNNLYIVDGGTNRLIVTDQYYKLKYQIDVFINEWGVPDSFNNPQGVFVGNDRIYVADTDNNRIVIFGLDGTYECVVYKPDSSMFSSSSLYKPCAVVADKYGRMFIISSTTYQGVVVMDMEGRFFGFIGAQKVSLTAWEKIVRMFQSDEARKYSKQFIPTEFNNIDIDVDEFLYVTISSIEEEDQQAAIEAKDTTSDYAPVKKINGNGDDVMRRNGFYPPSGEIKVTSEDLATHGEIYGASSIVDVAHGPEGTWSIIDEKRSKVYTYDDDGNLLFIFGDVGAQKGMIQTARAITYQGNNIVLVDGYYNSLTVYRRTEYGDILLNALYNQNNRIYSSAYEDWIEILKRNNNFDAAYIGVGKALYRAGEYEASLDYYKAALETENYSLSYKEIRKEWMSNYFFLIILVIVIVVVLLGKLLGSAAKYNKKVALKIGRKTIKDELVYAFHVIVHPFDGFWDLKHEKRGSAKSAFVLLILTILAFFYQSVSTGYIFQPDESDAMSIFTSILAVFIPVILWTVGNWCMTTLMEGEGTLTNIFVATCYALVPCAIFTFVSTVLSNFMLDTEGDLITLLKVLGFVWTGLLLFFGIMQTHDYSMGRNVLTIICTIVAMVFIMFVAILFSTLMTKIVTFIYNIVVEIDYHV